MIQWQKGMFFDFYLPTAVVLLTMIAPLSRAPAETVVPAHLQTVGSLDEVNEVEKRWASVQFELAILTASTALYAIELNEMRIADQQDILQQIEETNTLIVQVRESYGVEIKEVSGQEQYQEKIEEARTAITLAWEQYFAQVPAARKRALYSYNRDAGVFEQYLKPTLCALPFVQAGTVPESGLCQE